MHVLSIKSLSSSDSGIGLWICDRCYLIKYCMLLYCWWVFCCRTYHVACLISQVFLIVLNFFCEEYKRFWVGLLPTVFLKNFFFLMFLDNICSDLEPPQSSVLFSYCTLLVHSWICIQLSGIFAVAKRTTWI